MPDTAIELHIVSEDTEIEIAELARFCEQKGYPVIRLFWRGIEPEDVEER